MLLGGGTAVSESLIRYLSLAAGAYPQKITPAAVRSWRVNTF
jgi:hypothetical protein